MLRCTTFLSNMLETTVCSTLNITSFKGSTILFHRLCKLLVLTPIASVSNGPTIFLQIIFLGKISLMQILLIVMDLKKSSNPNTMLVMILNIKLIMLLSL
jgi:hypothetical protein